MKTSLLKRAFTLIELLVVISIIAILAGIALPVFSQVQERGAQTKDLSNAKQIGLSCKLYATDNNGLYPGTTADTDSNASLKLLIPQYVPTEKIFFVPKSVWTSQAPDEKFAASTDALIAGENAYAYVAGLTDTSNPNFPLIADGFNTTTGAWNTTENTKGGVWKGKKAIVIRTDTSGAVEKLDATTYKFLAPYGGSSNADMFSATVMGTGVKVNNPL